MYQNGLAAGLRADLVEELTALPRDPLTGFKGRARDNGMGKGKDRREGQERRDDGRGNEGRDRRG